jgi:hypothetical protein
LLVRCVIFLFPLLSQKSLLQAVKKGKEFANSVTKMTKLTEFSKSTKG